MSTGTKLGCWICSIQKRSRRIGSFDRIGILISATSFAFPTCRQAAAAIRRVNPGVPIVVGGAHASVARESVLGEKEIDYGICGKGEVSLLELVETLERDPRAPAHHLREINGLVFRNGEDIVVNPPRARIANVDEPPLPSYDIYPMVDVGIVHSSRSGCELAMYGVPVILTGDNHYRGKGFTIDVSSEEEFYDSIQSVLTHGESKEAVEERIQLSRKYWLLYDCHGFVNLNLFNQGWTKPVELLFDSLDDFLPGNNTKLDYVCDAILSGEPIFGDSRWPPISL